MVSCKRIPSSCIHFRFKFPACLLGACFFFSRFSRPRRWRWSTCLRSRGLHRCLGWVHPNSFGLKKIYRKFHVSFTLSTNSTDSTIHLKQASLLYTSWTVHGMCARATWSGSIHTDPRPAETETRAPQTQPTHTLQLLLFSLPNFFQQARLQLPIKALQHNQRSNWERINVTLV